MQINLKMHWLAMLMLILLAVNYLIINLFRLDNSMLIYGRGVVVILLLILFLGRPSVYRTELFLIVASFFSVLIGFPGNSMAINIVFLLFFVICIRNVQLEKIINYGILVLVLSLVLTFLLLYLGVIKNTIDVVDGRERFGFGFTNTNAFTSLVYSFIVLGLYKWRRNAIATYILFFALAYITFLYTDNRTLLASILILVLAHALFRIFLPGNLLKYISAFLLLLPIVLTQLSGYILGEFPLIDTLLSSRLSFSVDFINKMSGVNYIFGGLSPGTSTTIDNSFLLIQASVGMPFLLFVTWLTFKKISDCIVKKQAETYALILSVWYFSFSESSMVRPEAIIGLVFWLLIFRPLDYARKRENSSSNENSFA